MTSALNTKINSYSLQLGIEMDQTASLTPTTTGSITLSAFTLTGSLPTYEANVGPAGGAGSWRFKSGPTSGDCRLRNTTSALMTSINDRDFSIGFWVKINSAPPVGGGAPIQSFQSFATTGYALNIINSAGVLSFTYDSPNGSYGVASGIELNRWYYFATRRTTTTTFLYLDGVQVNSFSFSGTGTNGSNINFGQITQGFECDTNICNFYEASTSVIDATAIAAIYDAGAFDNVVKYYDGSAWQTASGQKFYDGSKWVNFTNANTRRYDGSAWVEV